MAALGVMKACPARSAQDKIDHRNDADRRTHGDDRVINKAVGPEILEHFGSLLFCCQGFIPGDGRATVSRVTLLPWRQVAGRTCMLAGKTIVVRGRANMTETTVRLTALRPEVLALLPSADFADAYCLVVEDSALDAPEATRRVLR